MDRPALSERQAQILVMLKAGLTGVEVARRLGIHRSTVSITKSRLHNTGHLPPRAPRKSTFVYGDQFKRLYQQLPLETRLWIDSQTPKGGRPEQVVMACVIDAYHDAQEAGQ